MRSYAPFVSIILSVLCAQAASTAAPTASRMKTILVLGDSLSEGFQLKSSEAYPLLLADKLRAAGLNFQVTNASASGGTTEGGLQRLPSHLQRKIDIFILELGINDAFRGVPVDQIQSNLQEIIDDVKMRNPSVRVVIAGMQLPHYGADDYVSAFGAERPRPASSETSETATQGDGCDECVRKLRAPLMKVKGVKNVKVDLRHERVVVTFGARKTHPPDLRDAILNSG